MLELCVFSLAETLVRRGWITNHHLIAYSVSNVSAKNYQNRSITYKNDNSKVAEVKQQMSQKMVLRRSMKNAQWHQGVDYGVVLRQVVLVLLHCFSSHWS